MKHMHNMRLLQVQVYFVSGTVNTCFDDLGLLRLGFKTPYLPIALHAVTS